MKSLIGTLRGANFEFVYQNMSLPDLTEGINFRSRLKVILQPSNVK